MHTCTRVQPNIMNDNTNFVQLLELARDKFALTDREIAAAIDCEPTYLSRLRHGKQNAGPSVTRALEKFLEGGSVRVPKPDLSKATIASLASLARVDEQAFLSRLLARYGLETALELKNEHEASTAPGSSESSERVAKAGAETFAESVRRIKPKPNA